MIFLVEIKKVLSLRPDLSDYLYHRVAAYSSRLASAYPGCDTCRRLSGERAPCTTYSPPQVVARNLLPLNARGEEKLEDR
jgi:hypothetical protein